MAEFSTCQIHTTMCPAAPHQAEEKAAERVEREATEVYAAIRPDGGEPAWAQEIPELRPTLRPYQSRALAWMVQRERAAQVPKRLECVSSFRVHSEAPCSGHWIICGTSVRRCALLTVTQLYSWSLQLSYFPCAGQVKQEASAGCHLHPLWREVPTSHGSFYLQSVFGLVSLQRFPPPPPVAGGMLAEEMVRLCYNIPSGLDCVTPHLGKEGLSLSHLAVTTNPIRRTSATGPRQNGGAAGAGVSQPLHQHLPGVQRRPRLAVHIVRPLLAAARLLHAPWGGCKTRGLC
jgi:hypothetical protein